MTTYTIVASTTNPLGPGEIAAGGNISVAEGDVFVIDPSADSNITFTGDGGGGTINFDVQFNASNANTFKLCFQGNVNPSVEVADGADLSSIDLAAQGADGFTLSTGDNVTLGKLDASEGADSITLGDNFTANGDWNLLGGNDVMTVGENAVFTASKIKGGLGNDQITFGDGANFGEIDGEGGNDTLSFGDDVAGVKIIGGSGNDTFNIGFRATITDKVDGGSGTDTLNTATTGFTTSNTESANVVCYAPGTLIDTPDGPRAVETLQIGDLVETLDHGPQLISWVRSSDHPLEEVEVEAKPVLIAAGALGQGRPTQDLIVSPQHRMLVGGGGQLDGWFACEALAPAKSLTVLRGIRHMKGKQNITWIHFACARHEVVFANGCLSESLLVGPRVMNGLTGAERGDLAAIYGLAASLDAALNGPPARACLRVGEVRLHLATCSEDRAGRNAEDIKKWDRDLAMERYEAKRLGLGRPKDRQESLRFFG